MVAAPLSESKITAGQDLLKALDRKGVRVDAALWYFFAEKESWKLVLLLPKLIAKGPRATYREIQNVLGSADPPIALDLLEVTAARPESEPITAFQGIVGTSADSIGQARFTQCVFNRQFVEDALVYRMVPSRNGSRAKKKNSKATGPK